jgi:hypothetical protein
MNKVCKRLKKTLKIYTSRTVVSLDFSFLQLDCLQTGVDPFVNDGNNHPTPFFQCANFHDFTLLFISHYFKFQLLKMALIPKIANKTLTKYKNLIEKLLFDFTIFF